MTDPKAPHGYDDNGVPKAPFGINIDGTPRKSRRGAVAGQQGVRAKAKPGPARAGMSTSNLTDMERKQMLCELGDQLLVSPLAAASQLPPVVAKLGRRQADALAGDAFILANYLPGVADGLLLLAKTKPKALAWMDKIEHSAPFLVLAQALIGAGKALVANHVNPDPSLASAGRSMAALKMAQMAAAVNDQADAIRERARQAAEYAASAERTSEFAAVG